MAPSEIPHLTVIDMLDSTLTTPVAGSNVYSLVVSLARLENDLLRSLFLCFLWLSQFCFWLSPPDRILCSQGRELPRSVPFEWTQK